MPITTDRKYPYMDQTDTGIPVRVDSKIHIPEDDDLDLLNSLSGRYVWVRERKYSNITHGEQLGTIDHIGLMYGMDDDDGEYGYENEMCMLDMIPLGQRHHILICVYYSDFVAMVQPVFDPED